MVNPPVGAKASAAADSARRSAPEMPGAAGVSMGGAGGLGIATGGETVVGRLGIGGAPGIGASGPAAGRPGGVAMISAWDGTAGIDDGLGMAGMATFGLAGSAEMSGNNVGLASNSSKRSGSTCWAARGSSSACSGRRSGFSSSSRSRSVVTAISGPREAAACGSPSAPCRRSGCTGAAPRAAASPRAGAGACPRRPIPSLSRRRTSRTVQSLLA